MIWATAKQPIPTNEDRDFLIETVFLGTAKPAASTIPGVFSTYNDAAPLQYPFDLKKAAALLDAAYNKGEDGTRFNLRLAFLAGETFRKTSEYFRSSFGKLGIKVKIRGCGF